METDNNNREDVVICFQISIFEPLETTDYLLLFEYHFFKRTIRKEKSKLFSTKIPSIKTGFFILKEFQLLSRSF